jgi:hypothetical protein
VCALVRAVPEPALAPHGGGRISSPESRGIQGASKPLKMSELVDPGIQIAEALGVAHSERNSTLGCRVTAARSGGWHTHGRGMVYKMT